MPTAPTSSLYDSRSPLERFAQRLRSGLCRAGETWKVWMQPRPRISWDASPALCRTWQQCWGESYGPELKRWTLQPVFDELDEQGKIGELIVDIGSGATPVTRLLRTEGGRRILVDIASDNGRSGDEQRIRLDVETVANPATLSFRKALVRVCRFLQIDPKSQADAGRANTIVISDLLNYVDFSSVLRGFANFLKPGGRFIISNLPMRGNEALFCEKGLKNNHDLYRFLEEERFEIEHKSFPCRARGETEESHEFVVIVARKRGT